MNSIPVVDVDEMDVVEELEDVDVTCRGKMEASDNCATETVKRRKKPIRRCIEDYSHKPERGRRLSELILGNKLTRLIVSPYISFKDYF